MRLNHTQRILIGYMFQSDIIDTDDIKCLLEGDLGDEVLTNLDRLVELKKFKRFDDAYEWYSDEVRVRYLPYKNTTAYEEDKPIYYDDFDANYIDKRMLSIPEELCETFKDYCWRQLLGTSTLPTIIRSNGKVENKVFVAWILDKEPLYPENYQGIRLEYPFPNTEPA